MNDQNHPKQISDNCAFILIGKSGSGKGTQGARIQEYLKSATGKDTLYIQTGGELRNFIQQDNYTARLAKDIYDAGGLQPEFLTIYAWSRLLSERYDGNSHIIFDGTPRKVHEAGAVHSVFDFFGIGKCFVVYVNITDEEAERRLLLRARMDDNIADIETRLTWFSTHVLPTVEYYRHNPHYYFIEVDGMASPDAVYDSILSKIKPLI